MPQVLGDEEQAGGVEAGDHGLADVDAAVDDGAPNRRFDRAIAEVDSCRIHRGFVLADRCHSHCHVGLGHFIIGQGGIVVGIGDRLLGEEALRSFPLSLGLPGLCLKLQLIGFRLLQRCLRLLQRCFVGGGVDFRQQGAFLDDGAVVDQLGRIVGIGAEFQDQTHDLRTHVNNLFRLHGSRGADRREQIAPLDRRRAEARRGIGGHMLGVVRRAASRNTNQNKNRKYGFHGSPANVTQLNWRYLKSVKKNTRERRSPIERPRGAQTNVQCT